MRLVSRCDNNCIYQINSSIYSSLGHHNYFWRHNWQQMIFNFKLQQVSYRYFVWSVCLSLTCTATQSQHNNVLSMNSVEIILSSLWYDVRDTNASHLHKMSTNFYFITDFCFIEFILKKFQFLQLLLFCCCCFLTSKIANNEIWVLKVSS